VIRTRKPCTTRSTGSARFCFVAAAGTSRATPTSSRSTRRATTSQNVIAVAATDHTDGLAWFSNFGRGNVRIAAPGQNVYSTIPAVNVWNMPGGYGYLDGTSMATPHRERAGRAVEDGGPDARLARDPRASFDRGRSARVAERTGQHRAAVECQQAP
jgi:hypothetical protein